MQQAEEEEDKVKGNLIGIFWDWENIEIPSDVDVVDFNKMLDNIRECLRFSYGNAIKETNIYHDSSKERITVLIKNTVVHYTPRAGTLSIVRAWQIIAR